MDNLEEKLDNVCVIIQQQKTTLEDLLVQLKKIHVAHEASNKIVKPKRNGITARKSSVKAMCEFISSEHTWVYINKGGRMYFDSSDIMFITWKRGVRVQRDNNWLDKIEYDCFFTKGIIGIHVKSSTNANTKDFSLLFQKIGLELWNKKFIIK